MNNEIITTSTLKRMVQEINDLKIINEEHRELNGMLNKEIERLNNIISKIEKAVEIAIKEDNYDGGIYDIKDILRSDNNG